MLVVLCLTICTSFSAASLLAYLRHMPRLYRLQLNTDTKGMPSSINPRTPPTNPGNIFQLSKLTSLHFPCHSSFLNALVAGFTAPYLEDVQIVPHDFDSTTPPILHRFLDGVEKQYHSVQVISKDDYFPISLLTHSESVNQPAPSFRFSSPFSIR